MPRHFLTILDLSQKEAYWLVQRAKALKDTDHRSDLLAGKNLVMLFEKASTRTRISFEVAVAHLGGRTVFMTPNESQLGRGEPVKDTARVVSRYAQGMIVRTFGQDKLEELKEYASVPVINALSDQYHPCQVMSDVLTMYERTPDLADLKVAWVGDGNNMAQSWINAAVQFPFFLSLAFPRGYEPDRRVIELAIRLGARIHLTNDPVEAVRDARYVNTDVFASMGQEEEEIVRRARFAPYQVNDELLAHAHPDCQVLHCLPAHRGEELTEEVLEGPRSIVWDQAENRLHMQKAILELVYGAADLAQVAEYRDPRPKHAAPVHPIG